MVIFSYFCHSSFISDKDVSHNNSTLLTTNSELYDMEIRWKFCKKSSHVGNSKKSKIRDFWRNFDEICIFDEPKMAFIRVGTIVTIGLSRRPIVALSDDYRSRYFFTDCCTDSATGCRARLWLIYDIHSEVVSTAMLLFSELPVLNCDSMLA